MFIVSSDNVIRLTKGNSAVIQIVLYDEAGDIRLLSNGDVVLFTVKKPYGTTVLQKELTESDQTDAGTLNCLLEPSDTIELPIGEYKYDCLFITSDGQADTFISSMFYITEAFGFYTDITDTGGDGG